MSNAAENLTELALREKCDVQIWFWGKINRKWEVTIGQRNEGIRLEIKEQSGTLEEAITGAMRRYERAKQGLGVELAPAIEGSRVGSKQLPPVDDEIPF